MADESYIMTVLRSSAALSTLVGNRIWDQRVPENIATPLTSSYIISEVVATTPENYLDGPPNVDLYTIQFDIYAQTKSECKQILTVMRGLLSGIGYETFSQDFLDESTDLRRLIVNYDFFIPR
jgi:hypothetical protein